jgi:hypothetical protein
MRKFFSIGLALALGFFVTIAMGHASGGLTTHSDLRVGRAAELTSFASTQSNAVEKDGIRFETLVPEPVLTIPANQPGVETPVRLGLRITNNTRTPLRFTRFDSLYPELVGPDGKVVGRIQGRNVTIAPTEADCPIAQPGENLSFFLDGKLSWQSNKLELGGSDGFGGIWLFQELKPGAYQFRFIYSSPSSRTLPCDLALGKKKSLWIGGAVTPFVEIRLVQP